MTAPFKYHEFTYRESLVGDFSSDRNLEDHHIKNPPKDVLTCFIEPDDITRQSMNGLHGFRRIGYSRTIKYGRPKRMVAQDATSSFFVPDERIIVSAFRCPGVLKCDSSACGYVRPTYVHAKKCPRCPGSLSEDHTEKKAVLRVNDHNHTELPTDEVRRYSRPISERKRDHLNSLMNGREDAVDPLTGNPHAHLAGVDPNSRAHLRGSAVQDRVGPLGSGDSSVGSGGMPLPVVGVGGVGVVRGQSSIPPPARVSPNRLGNTEVVSMGQNVGSPHQRNRPPTFIPPLATVTHPPMTSRQIPLSQEDSQEDERNKYRVPEQRMHESNLRPLEEGDPNMRLSKKPRLLDRLSSYLSRGPPPPSELLGSSEDDAPRKQQDEEDVFEKEAFVE